MFILLQRPFYGDTLLNVDDIVCILKSECDQSTVYMRNGCRFDVLEAVGYIVTLLDSAEQSKN
jgi:hypothetical protein